MRHLTDSQLDRLLSQSSLPDDERNHAFLHLAECDECRDMLGVLASLRPQSIQLTSVPKDLDSKSVPLGRMVLAAATDTPTQPGIRHITTLFDSDAQHSIQIFHDAETHCLHLYHIGIPGTDKNPVLLRMDGLDGWVVIKHDGKAMVSDERVQDMTSLELSQIWLSEPILGIDYHDNALIEPIGDRVLLRTPMNSSIVIWQNKGGFMQAESISNNRFLIPTSMWTPDIRAWIYA